MSTEDVRDVPISECFDSVIDRYIAIERNVTKKNSTNG
jgi:hypothetical protein